MVDWIVLPGALAIIALVGLWRGRSANTVNRYLLAGRELPWYVVGLSIMATQASAVTFTSTPGQAYVDGMRFVQFYFGLPIAMLILSYSAVPLFRKAGVYTAYEFLEKRFDARVRALVSGIFLLQRGLALGITLYAPAVVLTVIFGWPDWITTVVMGGIAVAYTTKGGVKAIAGSDVTQMAVMTLGLIAALLSAVLLLPAHVTFGGATTLADAMGRLNVITTDFSWADRYNLWSGLIGGAFLALAYFGTDQSQVQRYLTARSVTEARRGLLFNAAAKIPMQLMVLFIGAMVFVFYIYEKPPVLFQRTELARIQAPAVAAEFAPIQERYDRAFEARRAAADDVLRGASAGGLKAADQDMNAARRDAAALAVRSGGSGSSDTNYIFMTFVTQHIPAGLVGLILAVVFGATMAAISAEMSALATVSVVDIYKRHIRTGASDHHYLNASRMATLFWGVYAVIAAQLIKGIGALIEVVNVVGSLFYGGMLGVFVLAFFFRRVGARAAFYAVLLGEAVIFACWYYTSIAFLWYNVIGCVVVVLSALAMSALAPRRAGF